MHNSFRIGLSAMAIAALATACSSAQEYEVTGQIESAQTLSGNVVLEFFEVPAEDGAEAVSIKTAELKSLGAFSEKVDVDPAAKLRIVAFGDANGDGSCSDGELSAQVEIGELAEDGSAPDPVTLKLVAQPCPE